MRLGSAKLGPEAGFNAPKSPVLTDHPLSLRAMAPCKTKQPLEPSSTAAPVAVGRPNAKASRRPRARGTSRATTQLDAVVSGEEFSLQGIEDDDEISDSVPPNPSPELEVLNVPANTNAALDILHFFSGTKSTRGKSSSKEETPPLKICKLCSYVSTSLIFILLSYDKQCETRL